ncbi:DUF4360 domain-containing protein [Nostoc sp. NMS4]|uniref:DUF4360 domain-containing protein n=1 Tax=Nostoc sp. NMS4 TaxID=2815390 RepID=UPI0025CF7CAF|nr:DUF4360 domain-containing protein [Nostoc sp. NMS4]MBN3926766.1 DUF4360 domain-containing protein [Nostoc sp. NMS4]
MLQSHAFERGLKQGWVLPSECIFHQKTTLNSISTIHMNIKQLGTLVSVSTILGMNVITTKAFAAPIPIPSITFGKAIGSGGCTVAGQLLGDDKRSLSIILDNFAAFEGQRKICILRINTTIPSGFFVQNVQVLYQGTVGVKLLSKGSTLSRSYIFNGGALGLASAVPKITKFTSDNPLFQEQDDILIGAASCGGKGQLGINLIEKSTSGSSITVDTADLSAGDVLLRIDLSPC